MLVEPPADIVFSMNSRSRWVLYLPAISSHDKVMSEEALSKQDVLNGGNQPKAKGKFPVEQPKDSCINNLSGEEKQGNPGIWFNHATILHFISHECIHHVFYQFRSWEMHVFISKRLLISLTERLATFPIKYIKDKTVEPQKNYALYFTFHLTTKKFE